jgi:cell wall-associated NlpC family hydrolase
MARHQLDEASVARGLAVTTWWGAYIGRSFGDRNECWSLVREVYRDRLGIDLPEHGEVSAAYVAAVETIRQGDTARLAEARRQVVEAFEAGQAAECWMHNVTEPRIYDVVRMGGKHGNRRRVLHVGIVVDRHRMLHIEKATGSVVVPLNHVSVTSRLLGFSRHIQCPEF